MTSKKGELLSVVTAVSRPRNLPLISWCIPPDAEWVLVTDGPHEHPALSRPHVWIEGPQTGGWGDAQRRVGIQAATRPYLYFLDDDNLMLPALPDLVLPFLETGEHAGLLFGLLVNLHNQTHLWPPPLQIARGRVDTAMFVGRRDAIGSLRFANPNYGTLWPDLKQERHGDFVFIEAFDSQIGLARLPSIYGFHDAFNLLGNIETDMDLKLRRGELTGEQLLGLLQKGIIHADVPQWWDKSTIMT
jgi:hypothetical protein